MNIQSIRLDLDKRVTVAEHVVIGQGDKGGTTIVAHIFDHGVAYDLTDKSAMFEMRLPRQSEYVRDNCTVSGNTITYIVDEEHAAAVYGTTDCAYFDILIGDSVIASTARFTVDILRSARDGATPAQSWDTAIDDLIERGEQAVSDAEQAVDDATSAVDAANQAIARIEPTIEQAAEDAAEEAASEVEGRVQAAIDAMGDISELAVPLMTPDVRGGAKLEEHGGLALRDGALGIGSLVQESDGYARGGLAEVTAKGHAEQVQTTGKNLLKSNPYSGTYKGITVTAYNDGSIAFKGTATEDSYYVIETATMNQITVAAGDYTFSVAGLVDGLQFIISGGGQNGFPYKVLTKSFPRTTGTVTDGTKPFNYIQTRVLSGKTVDTVIYPQLELGSTATEYEPYTGGAPSPSPDYPQEIQVVRGRNLLPKMASQTISGVTATVADDGEITLNGTASATAFFYTACNIEAGAYTLSANNPESSSTGNLVFKLVDGQVADIFGASKQINAANTIESITTAVEAKSWVIRVASGTSFSNFKLKPQLELGSTPHPYVPYGHVGLEVQGKNLLPNIPSSYTSGATFVRFGKPVDFDGLYLSFYFSGSFTYGGAAFMAFVREDGTTAPITMGYMRLADDNTAPVAGTTYSHKKMTFTSSAQARYVEVRLYTSPAFTNLKFEGCVLNNSTTPMDYEPYYHHTTYIPLPPRGWVAGLPDGTADTLRLDGAGKVEWENRCTLRQITSTDYAGYYYADGGGYARAGIHVNDVDTVSSVTGGGTHLCTHFAHKNGELYNHPSIYPNQFAISAGASSKIIYMSVDASEFESAAQVRDWLVSNGVAFLLKLATPVTEDCGYVEDWPTDLPEGAVIDIPELSEVGIKFFIDSSVTELAKQWYERAQSEYADRITALEQAVAELATS